MSCRDQIVTQTYIVWKGDAWSNRVRPNLVINFLQISYFLPYWITYIGCIAYQGYKRIHYKRIIQTCNFDKYVSRNALKDKLQLIWFIIFSCSRELIYFIHRHIDSISIKRKLSFIIFWISENIIFLNIFKSYLPLPS